MQIKLDEIKKSYNGATGCACGCKGNYSFPSHVDLADVNKSVGYNAYDASDVSDRRVKTAVNKLNKMLADPNTANLVDVWMFGASYDNGSRVTTVYFDL